MLPQSFEIEITKELIDNSEGFSSPKGCPLAKICKEKLGNDFYCCFVSIVETTSERIIYRLDKPFLADDYENVKRGANPFKTVARLKYE